MRQHFFGGKDSVFRHIPDLVNSAGSYVANVKRHGRPGAKGAVKFTGFKNISVFQLQTHSYFLRDNAVRKRESHSGNHLQFLVGLCAKRFQRRDLLVNEFVGFRFGRDQVVGFVSYNNNFGGKQIVGEAFNNLLGCQREAMQEQEKPK